MKKQIRNLLAALCLGSMTLTAACSDNDNETPGGDRSPVTYDKQHDTAILLVTFGSTWDDPHLTYEKQLAQFRQEFPDADFFFSFTSTTCINRWHAASGELFITPDLWLESFLEKAYDHVYVQSLHVIPGEEFMLLRDYYVKTFYSFPAEELGREAARVGEALLRSEADIEEVGKALVDTFRTELEAGDAVAFMGHGNPSGDYAHANLSYANLETFMKTYAAQTYGNGNIFVGTVDYPEMLIDYVLEGLAAADCPNKKVHLHPLMSIAGDHANNDMSGEEEAGVPDDEQSWAVQIEKSLGWEVTCIRKGLGDYEAINKVWIRHLHEAIETGDAE